MKNQDETLIAATPELKVIPHFTQYVPPFDVERMARRMLRTVPSEYLVGLDAVVLSNTDSLSRKRLRSTTKSRKRKIRIADTRGLYHHASSGGAAWVEIFVDKAYERWTTGLWSKVPIIRDMPLSDVLFHEIGHHIHATSRPEFREREEVAESWRRKLESKYFHQQYLFVRVLSLIMRPVMRLFGKKLTSLLTRKES